MARQPTQGMSQIPRQPARAAKKERRSVSPTNNDREKRNQGIERDQRGQLQPTDRKRAQFNR
jgi:hypothetical protein